MSSPVLSEGWYLMSVRDLEIELVRHRDPDRDPGASGAERLTIEQGLAYRAAGNLPDEYDRTLRLVLFVDDQPISEKRLRYEPDFHSAPTWRREGSRPINVVPLAVRGPLREKRDIPWWEQSDVAPLEAEWQRTGTVAGLAIPADMRSFVLKTIASLRAAGVEVTHRSILDSVSRWLSPSQVAELRAAFDESNRR